MIGRQGGREKCVTEVEVFLYFETSGGKKVSKQTGKSVLFSSRSWVVTWALCVLHPGAASTIVICFDWFYRYRLYIAQGLK